MIHEPSQGDDADSPSNVGSASGADNRESTPDDIQAIGSTDSAEKRVAGGIGFDPRPSDAKCRLEVQATNGSAATSVQAHKNSRHSWRKWGVKVWAGGLATIVTGIIGAWLIAWFNFLAGPPITASPPSVSIGYRNHLPGRLDVSTMASGHHFYAVPDFYDFQSCGRPCWLPLYQYPTEKSRFVTDGWPCEYYEPGSTANGPFCLKPAVGRKPNEMAHPAISNSGDRVFVICQVTDISKGRQSEDIHNNIDQDSNIWDMVAVPRKNVSSDSVVAGKLRQVPDMPGFYQAFAADIWLGNTGSHGIPCK